MAYFFVVTEREITQGIFKNSQSEDTCLCVMRKIPDIELHLTDPKAPKFIDLASQKEVDNEAQELLNSLRNKKVPSKVQNTNLTQVVSSKQSMAHCQLWLRFFSELSSATTSNFVFRVILTSERNLHTQRNLVHH